MLGSGTPDLGRLAQVFREICSTPVEDDGVVFAPGSVQARRIKEEAAYEGVRITLDGKLGSARLAVQVDVGFGDSVVPVPKTIAFPTLLPFPGPVIRAYAKETVVAEKLHAMVDLGMANSRMKDFFDVWFLSREFEFEFEGHSLIAAIRGTFERRHTPIPEGLPMALTDTFARDPTKLAQWSAFLARSQVISTALSLPEVVSIIASFLAPAFEAITDRASNIGSWNPGGPWG
ncbi:MAG TPA: nucleotidyl transferase AbiEii/AbiGii toxin family protein [Polyangiaceae bacterium]|nr:nucleotidyl transferase AbiEii/AbiGii toxin family protein [Polyangiaceae bacterium]